MITSFRDLKVWQTSMTLATATYGYVKRFPQGEGHGLRWQMERCAVSIPSNIAEGHARASTKEYLHHLSIAVGSLAELETQIRLACRLDFVTEESTSTLLSMADEVGRMLRGVQKSLRSRIKGLSR